MSAKSKQSNIISVFFGTILLIVGIFMLVNRKETIRYLTISTGILVFLSGIRTLVELRKWKSAGFSSSLVLIKGFLMVIFGMIAVIYPATVSKFYVAWFRWMYSIVLLFTALVSLMSIFSTGGRGLGIVYQIAEAVMAVILAILFMTGDFTDTFIVILGVIIIMTGMIFIFSSLYSHSHS